MPATVKGKQIAKKAKLAKATYVRKSAERANAVADIKAQYLAKSNDPVLVDILDKAKNFISYHNKVAQDGMGARVSGKTESGNDIVETIYLTNDQRAAHLDNSKGIQELVDYIERMITVTPSK